MDSNLSAKRKEVAGFFLDNNMLLSKDFIEKVSSDFDKQRFYEWLNAKAGKENLLLLNNHVIDILNEGCATYDWSVFERTKALEEKGIDRKSHNDLLESIKNRNASTNRTAEGHSCVSVISSYDQEPKKKEISDFIYLFNKRYEAIKRILLNRQELQSATSISRLSNKKDKSACSVIGSVMDKSTTANGNIMLTLEDQTGTIKVFFGKNKPELFELAREIVLDEVIGVTGTNGDNIIFANNILLPDMPVHKEIKKSPDKCYAVFLSDLHVGSDKFLPGEFRKFLSWIRGETGTESQKFIASRVKYIFIVGDLVDGVGIYPEQDSELEIKDIYEQYTECAMLLKEIPNHIRIIICPGNHDALRISEPQPQLSREYAKSLWGLNNVIMVSNPALVNIHSSENFPGFDVLLYHGYSFDYYVANVDPIREKGGYDRADLIMKFLLQRRHLAPAYTSTLYVADPQKDHLVLERPPDFFATGHIHKSYVASYRNITTICGSCWQSTTTFQEKVGHNPEPARVPIVDLNTRKVKILRFDK